MGWYNVRSILFAFGEEALPLKVWATSTFAEGGITHGVPLDLHGKLPLTFPFILIMGILAPISCSLVL